MDNTPRMLAAEFLRDAAECLKTLGHPARLRIVDILMQGEFPVHQIAGLCELPPHQTCEHLRLLQVHGLLASQRRGRAVFYRIVDPRLPRLMGCIRASCDTPLVGTESDLSGQETRERE
jgi:DNA-binding transcriptional ArsR family regulator